MTYHEVLIQNFRGIEKLEISDLKRINLLVGRNNCGKTTVLEALFLLSGMSNPQLPFRIHQFRDLLLVNDEDFRFMFRNLDFDLPLMISAMLDRKRRRLEIKPLFEHYKPQNAKKPESMVIRDQSISALSNVVSIVKGLNFEFESEANRHFSASISLTEKKWKFDKKYTERLRCAFLNPKTIMNDLDKRLNGMIIQKRLDRLIPMLREIEPLVSDLRMGTGGMIYVDVGKTNLLPLNIMGDGMCRILSILASIFDMHDGILLIDEIENGLHYSSLLMAWEAICAACKEYAVQLIATTHSYECIQALSRAYHAIEPDGDEIRLYRIEKSDEIHKAYKATGQMLKTGLEKQFEVR